MEQIDGGGLIVSNVTVSYDGVTNVLDGLDLRLATGQVLGLLGQSGSGKSTLLRAIAGLEELASGNIFWDGKDLRKIPPHMRGFGFMFQDGQLFAHMSVGQNIAYGLKRKGFKKQARNERILSLLKQVGLEGYENREVSSLSGGQAQRVALARALAPEPQLLLLDEPLSSLDAELRGGLADDLARILRERGITAILVTHDEREAGVIADRVQRINQGKLV